MKKFVQKFQKVARRNGYKRRLLVEKFKRGMNRVIRKRLMKSEHSPISIKQWYERITNLDKY